MSTGLLEGPAPGTAGLRDDLVTVVEVFGEVFSLVACCCLDGEFWVLALHFWMLEDGYLTTG